MELTRAQILAQRWSAQGLAPNERAAIADDVAVLDAGVRSTALDSALLAVGARMTSEAATADVLDHPGLGAAVTLRGAPHIHRAASLPVLAGALPPIDTADAVARYGANLLGPTVDLQEAFWRIVDDLRQLADDLEPPSTKGELSMALDPLLGPELLRWCRGCQSDHVPEMMFRDATLPAGWVLTPSARRALTFEPSALIPPPPAPVPDGFLAELARRFLRLYGPGSQGQLADWLGSAALGERAWSAVADEPVEVTVSNKRRWVHPDDLDRFTDPPRPRGVALLPPYDPWLEPRDRELTAPNPTLRKTLWKILGNPGAVVSAAETVGTWRARTKGKRLTITVETVRSLRPAETNAVDVEAERVARQRNLSLAAVVTG